MLFNHLDKSKQSQRGSIMLEVIAVLALMGVMGAMLFRQIYQRNQELHNIQMASEMRTIKEAFSAYIQAERAVLIDYCEWDNETFKSGASTVVKNCNQPNVSGYIANHVKTYLPDGWFADSSGASTLHNYYTFSLWGTLQNDITSKKILYGVIVPKSETIPQTGWNFKRAARVALLIGADGGVYEKSGGITGNDIAGALGTWSLAMDADKMCDGDCPEPTYVAMTGMDIFTPEYELPEGNVTFEEELDLGMRDAQAWQYFAAGGNQGCYTIKHTIATDVGGSSRVQNDDIKHAPSGCAPLFFVDQTANGGTGKVFVNHDLEVGKIDGGNATPNVTITQGGSFQQANGLTVDPLGHIVAQRTGVADNAGELKAGERYVVDPAYTSNMNDIRLASRGGARLSDILPNYILKASVNPSINSAQTTCTISSGNKSCSTSTAIPAVSCPSGYTGAYLITPVQFATDVKTNKSTPISRSVVSDSNSNAKNFLTSSNTGSVELKKDSAGGHTDTDGYYVQAGAGSDFLTSGSESRVISKADKEYAEPVSGNRLSISFDESSKNVTFTYDENLNTNAVMGVRVDSYCVFNGDGAYTGKLPDKDDQTACKAAGFTWAPAGGIEGSAHCRYQYITCATINSGTNSGTPITDKAATCKAAGCTWNTSAGTCS